MRIAIVSSLFIAASLVQAVATEPGAFIAAHAKEHEFSGTILVQKGEKIRYAKSFGFANLGLKVPNANDTKYKIASITKAFTAVLILQLREASKVDLSKTLGTYLPEYSGEGRDKVTIHQLLNHTSGIDNFDKIKSADEALKNGIEQYQKPFTTDQLVARFCSGPLVSEPGKKFSYNNADYIILGKIIERIYGRTFGQVLEDKILKPVGLADTGLLYQYAIVPGLAATYFKRDDLKTLANDLPVYPENWFSAGSMYSTARDVAKFCDALFGGKLISNESLALMLTPGLDDYGYGLWSYEQSAVGKKYKVMKRPGQIMGAQTQLYHVLDPNITVVILSNTGTTDLDEFVAMIGKAAIGGAFD